uniref:Hexosyltransferase n=1 Tax=Wollemia nobilis TaxID=56998 RepID=A0A0C9RJ70_9CONI
MQPGKKRLLAVIGINTGFGSRLNRNRIRNTWMPTGQALRKLEEEGIVVRFVVGRSANRGDSLDRQINVEIQETNDFLVLESHEEATEELPQKAKFFFSSVVEYWDADFYVKVDDSIFLKLDEFVKILANLRGRPRIYMGCMKSGEVINEEGQQWYEPNWWKFGDEKSYFRHAAAPFYVLSRDLVRYININSDSLNTYAHEDISVGSWMIGLDTQYIAEKRFCCSSIYEDEICSIA